MAVPHVTFLRKTYEINDLRRVLNKPNLTSSYYGLMVSNMQYRAVDIFLLHERLLE